MRGANGFNRGLFCLRLAAEFAFMVILLAAGLDLAGAQECEGDPQALAEQCGAFVQKVGPRMDPSGGCCRVIKGTDVGCVCQHLPREIEQMLDMEKVVYVTTFCGKPLSHGSKCGSNAASITS